MEQGPRDPSSKIPRSALWVRSGAVLAPDTRPIANQANLHCSMRTEPFDCPSKYAEYDHKHICNLLQELASLSVSRQLRDNGLSRCWKKVVINEVRLRRQVDPRSSPLPNNRAYSSSGLTKSWVGFI